MQWLRESGAAGDSSRRPSVWGAAGHLVIRSGESKASERTQAGGEVRKPSFLGKSTAPVISFASIMVIIVPLGPALYSLQSTFTFTGLPYVSTSEVRQDCHPSVMVKGTQLLAREPAMNFSCFQRQAAKHRFLSRRCVCPTGRVGLSELTLHQLGKSHELLLGPSLSPSSC